MSRFLDRIFDLNYELSIWVEEEELGKVKIISHKDKLHMIKIPKVINQKRTILLRGNGKQRLRKTGDLLIHLWLNKGEDVRTSLWLSETFAKYGAQMKLFTGEKKIVMTIPPNSYNGLTIRLKGLGKGPSIDHRAPTLPKKKRGNLLVKLYVYTDSIKPSYKPFYTLSTENMALEGWVYLKYDEVIDKLGKSSIPDHPIPVSVFADLFNTGGWMSIVNVLVNHLKLGHIKIDFAISDSISNPGSCTRTPVVQNNEVVGYKYLIRIKELFLNNPFAIAAILAHELCHVVYLEKIDESQKSVGYEFKTEKATIEEERTVDLLVFLFKLGEFQLRVSRDKRLTLGYFNQEIFDRMQVIVSRKLNSS
jgi:hypothetical protein